jgi:hypothetical protein
MQIQIDTLKIDDTESKNGFTRTVDMLKSIINKVISVITNGPTAASAFNSALGEIIAKNMQVKARMYTGQIFEDYSSKVTGGKYEKVNEFMEKGNSVISEKLEKLKVKTLSDIREINEKRIALNTELSGKYGDRQVDLKTGELK